MAYEVIATETFESQYDAILRYYIEVLFAPSAAGKLIDGLEKARVSLSANPKLHAVSRQPMLRGLELRERHVGSCMVVYRIEESCVFLEHMFHQSQDFEHLV